MKPQQVVVAMSLGAVLVCGVTALSLRFDVPGLRYLLQTLPQPASASITLVTVAAVALLMTRLSVSWPGAVLSTLVWLGGLGVLFLYVMDRSAVAMWVREQLPDRRMPSPHSGLALVLLGIAITLTTTRRRIAVRIGHALALIAVSLTSLVLLAYLFNAQELYTVSAGVGMSPLLAFAMALLSFGALSVTPRFSLVRIFYMRSAGGRMARRFVPFVFGIPILVAAGIASGFRRNWFTAETALALLSICVMIVLGGVIWRYALSVNVAEARLERLVRSRTRSLTETITELEELAQTLAHDVRGPLINLREFLRIIRDEQENTLTGEGRDYLDRAIRASERLDRLTAAMLRYGELSRRPFQLAEVNVDALVRSVALSVRRSAPPGTTIDVRGPLARVWADEKALAELLRELLSNACRFTRPGIPPRVSVGCIATSTTVRLVVRDEGPGVKPQFHERIFHPFEQLARATEHTGIGLALVRRAITKMNGRVGVISDGEQGSTFWVELPRPQSRGALQF